MKYWIVLVVALSMPLSAQAQNWIQNPSCEIDGAPPPPWIEISGDWSCNAFAPTVPSLDGGDYFFAGASGDGELQQTIELTAEADRIDAGLITAEVSAVVRSWPQTPTDTARLVVEYRDAANAVILDSFDSSEIASVGSWMELSDQRLLPVGTRFARVRLLSTVNTGPDNDGYFDQLSLVLSTPVTAVPSLSEIGAGLLALFLVTASLAKLRRLG